MRSTLFMLLGVVGALWVFWYLYVLTMAFYRASLDGRLTGVAKWLAAPVVVVAFLVDLVANWTVASFWFREWPQVNPAWPLDLVTTRLSRYLDGPDGWRKKQANWLCQNLLDYFDPRGVHCK